MCIWTLPIRSTLRLFQTLLSISAVHQPFYIFMCIWTLPIRSTLRLFQTLLSISAVHQPFYILMCIWTLPIRSTLRLFQTLLSISAVHQPFYILMCIWTVNTAYTQHTMFISKFTFHIGSTPTFLYFDVYLNTAHTQHTTFIWQRNNCRNGLPKNIGTCYLITIPCKQKEYTL